MRELQLDSLHADGEHLVLIDADGTRYRVAISEALRVAVRRDRPHFEALRAREASALSPREIQARLRAGASVTEVATESGVDDDAIRRYEGPVRAEQAWVVEQTRALPVRSEVGSPTLGDLVVDRLAARGITTPPEWEAIRHPGEGWSVTASYPDSSGVTVARWRVDLPTRSVTALDDESRLLSEIDLGTRTARPFDVEEGARAAQATVRTAPSGQESQVSTDVLLDRLGQQRGRRSPEPTLDQNEVAAKGAPVGPAEDSTENAPDREVAIKDQEQNDEVGLFDLPPVLTLQRTSDAAGESAATESTRPEGETPSIASDDEPQTETPTAPASRGRKNRRASVPSWDEIVFGSKSD